MIISSNKKQTAKPKPREAKTVEIDQVKSWLTDKVEEEFLQLKPKNISQYIGQEKLKKQLKLVIDSAIIRQKLPEHILFYGQPGLGKTTLASLISKELNANFKVISAPSLSKIGDLVSLLMNIEDNTVLFIDEIHRLKAPLEETLYTAMESRQVDLVMGKATTSKSMRVDLPSFTLVGATTMLGKLSKPLKDRFNNVFYLEAYQPTEILEIIDKNSQTLNLKLTDSAKTILCRRCRGIPRITNNLLKRLRDYQLVHKYNELDEILTEEILQELGIFNNGLTSTDLTYLQSLQRGATGIKTISSILMEEADTIETVTEPYLLHLGLVDKSSDGRKLTIKGIEFLKKHNLLDKNQLIG